MYLTYVVFEGSRGQGFKACLPLAWIQVKCLRTIKNNLVIQKAQVGPTGFEDNPLRGV